jgi:hypothetical protein
LFLKRYGKLLSLAGAFLIFITFVVKEDYRDHLKQVIDAFTLADGLYSLRRDINTTQTQMDALTENTESGDQFIKNQGKSSFSARRLEVTAKIFIRPTVQSTDSMLLGINDLLTAVPHSKPLDKRYTDLKATHAILLALLDRFESDADKFERSSKPSPSGQEPISDSLQEAFGVLANQSHKFRFETEDLARQALEETQQKRLDLEKRYKIVTYLSYIVYAIGWFIIFINFSTYWKIGMS